MTGQTILVAATDDDRAQALLSILEFLDFRPIRCAAGAAAETFAGDAEGALALLCADDPGAIGWLAALAESHPQLPLFRLGPGPAGKIAWAGEIDWPLRYPVVHAALREAQAYRQRRADGNAEPRLRLFRSLVGNSPAIQRMRRMIEQVAGTDANVLVLGESGTGKEVVARNLHYRSARRERPFVPINCGAIPGELLESELFGHEKGAFTGAVTARQGRFELAEGGTLFLDEIGDMAFAMQVKLLRVLQERTFERVGSNRTIRADVRIIAATHRDLDRHVADGKFREDLYYRLNVFPIEVPPLRDRLDDLPLLVNEIAARIAHERAASVRFTPAALRVLARHPWPGNVRELANLVERMSILHPNGTVDARDLPERFRAGEPEDAAAEAPAQPSAPAAWPLPIDGIDLKEHLAQLEINLIQQALDEAGGVVAHAAKRLNMQRTTLVEKLRKYGMSRAGGVTDS